MKINSVFVGILSCWVLFSCEPSTTQKTVTLKPQITEQEKHRITSADSLSSIRETNNKMMLDYQVVISCKYDNESWEENSSDSTTWHTLVDKCLNAGGCARFTKKN